MRSLLALSLALVACSDPPNTPPPTHTLALTATPSSAPATHVTPPPSTASVGPPPSTASAAMPPPERRGSLAAYRAALAHGRSLAHAGDQAQAIVAFREALTAENGVSARCELGWAEYRAGQLDAAADDLARAVDAVRDDAIPVAERATYAACLYNRGRVAEASGDPTEAAAAYRRSLALRPNDTVSNALAALHDPPPPACPSTCVGPAPTREAIESAMLDRLRATHVPDRFWQGHEPSAPAWGRSVVEIPAGGPFLAAVVRVAEDGSSSYAGPDLSTAVVEAQLATGWFACAVLEASGGVNDFVTVDHAPALVVRGVELAAHAEVYNYDVEGAQMCAGCIGEDGDEEIVDGVTCDDVCDYETNTPYERVLVVTDGALTPRSPICP